MQRIVELFEDCLLAVYEFIAVWTNPNWPHSGAGPPK
jgi:hypothetical protein